MPLIHNALATLALVCIAQTAAASGGEPLRIGGTGAGLELMDRLGSAYSDGGAAPRAKILPSLGSGGGLKALSAGAVDIALISHRLGAAEAATGLGEAMCLRTPFVLATPVPRPPALTGADLVRIYSDPAAHWPDGSRIKLILRPEGEGDSQVLARSIPGLGDALAAARRRSEIPTAVTDQDNGDLAERTNGSLTAMSLAQLIAERRALSPIALDGVVPTAAALAAGDYKLRLDLCLVVRESMSPAVARFVAFLRSDRGRSLLRDNGAVPLEVP